MARQCCGALFILAGLAGWPGADASAQSPPLLGYVANENINPARLAIFKKGLADLGYIEGKSVTIEYRAAKLDGDYPRLVAELIGRRVEIDLALVATNCIEPDMNIERIAVIGTSVHFGKLPAQRSATAVADHEKLFLVSV